MPSATAVMTTVTVRGAGRCATTPVPSASTAGHGIKSTAEGRRTDAAASRRNRGATAYGWLSLQGEQARTPRQVVVVAAGAGVLALVEQLQVARVDGLGLVGVVADQVTVADVVGPGGAAVGLARERVALGRGVRGPGPVEAAGRERPEVAALGAHRLDEHQVLVLAGDL